MMQTLRNVALWFERRLHLVKLWEQTAGHPVPKSSGSWFYTFGSMTMLCLVIQIVTGIFLAMVYVPSAAEAYHSLERLNYEQPLGWVMRGMHYWGSTCMVIVMILHMTQVFLWGAYKYPREMTWLSGCVLLVITLGLAFSGQVMRFDADAYWGLGIGAAILGRLPFIGDALVRLMLGGAILGSETLSRFFSLHVFILPGAILAFLSLHLRLVLSRGINEPPKPGVLVKRNTYDAHYQAIIKREGVPFFPGAFNKDAVASGVLLLVILALAVFVGPKGPGVPAIPTLEVGEPKPDYPFLFIFAAAALVPNGSEILLFFVLPTLAGILLFALPFISNEGEKSWRRRPISVLAVAVALLVTGLLTYAGMTGPWSPHMEAWKSLDLKEHVLKGRTPLELQGALVFQNKQCRNCHAIDNEGGHRGPDLTSVATRMTSPQLVRQVIQGGGNMPAYGTNLSPPEVHALVAYLSSLHPPNVPPAREAIGPLSPIEQKRSGSQSSGDGNVAKAEKPPE
jgi:ubiquinol-cytochrome c reductase cytochrome b subunit